MYDMNNEVLQNIKPEILKDKYLKILGANKINQITCYPEIQNKIIQLNDAQLNVVTKCIEYYEKQGTEEWTNMTYEILKNITEYEELISNIGDMKKVDFNKITVILQNQNQFDIKSLEDVKNFEDIRKKKCDEQIREENLVAKKKAIFQKIFGHDIIFASEIIEKYGSDIEVLDDELCKNYVKSLKEIINLNNAEMLDSIYKQYDEVNLINKAEMHRFLKNQYAEKYRGELFDKELPENAIYEIGTKFSMLITSVGAYYQVGNVRNYKEDWNRPSISSQHFCTSYIRNDMIGTAPIKHICYGFKEIKKDELVLAGARDIYSSASSFVSEATQYERYYSPDNQINNTIRYNEIDIYRNRNGAKKQPDYIVVFRENGQITNMDEARKAQEQWKGLPIVIVDKDKCLESEKDKVEELMFRYNNGEKYLASEIWQKVRNNRQTNKNFCQDIDLQKLKEEYKIQRKVVKINKEQLEENYNNVTALERKNEIEKIKNVLDKTNELFKRGKEDNER